MESAISVLKVALPSAKTFLCSRTFRYVPIDSNVVDNEMNDESAYQLSRCLTSLETLYASDNQVGEEGIATIGCSSQPLKILHVCTEDLN